jgi:hypothetical protein
MVNNLIQHYQKLVHPGTATVASRRRHSGNAIAMSLPARLRPTDKKVSGRAAALPYRDWGGVGKGPSFSSPPCPKPREQFLVDAAKPAVAENADHIAAAALLCQMRND